MNDCMLIFEVFNPPLLLSLVDSGLCQKFSFLLSVKLFNRCYGNFDKQRLRPFQAGNASHMKETSNSAQNQTMHFAVITAIVIIIQDL